MEPMWCGHLSFLGLINHYFSNKNKLRDAIEIFQEEAFVWNRTTYGNIFNKMKKILARLDGIQKSPSYHYSLFLQDLESNLLAYYDRLLEVEKEF